MGWTQEDVIARLALKDIEVNHRRLTDWRQKGLLPDMEEVRDAHGRVAYVWNQANIVDQVEAVSRLFASYGRAHRFAHLLWLSGYEVRPELVMERIRAPILSMWRSWSGGAQDADSILDNISGLAIRMMRRRERRPSGYPDREQAAEQIERIMAAVAVPSYPTKLLLKAFARQSSPDRASALRAAAADARMIQTAKWFQRHLTLPILVEVASGASWEEYVQARADLAVLRDILTPLAEIIHRRIGTSDLDSRVWTLLRNGLLSGIGPWIIVGDMALRRAGYGRRISGYLRLARRWSHTPDVQKQMAEILSAEAAHDMHERS